MVVKSCCFKFRRSCKLKRAILKMSQRSGRSSQKRTPRQMKLVFTRYLYRNNGERSTEAEPLLRESEWSYFPRWISLCEDRGQDFKCFFSHDLIRTRADDYSGCYKCHTKPLKPNSPMLWCPQCDFWGMCMECAALPRLPSLRDDPLFFGRDHPCLLELPSQVEKKNFSYRGTMIICPGGNYEFLAANEAYPVAEWFAKHQIRAYVLRYRLLPKYDFNASLQDLSMAVKSVRQSVEGPLGAIGFSAGGHLVASLALQQDGGESEDPLPPLDAQVLVYPGLDANDWQNTDSCGFFDIEGCMKGVAPLMQRHSALLGGPGFAAPPTLLVASKYDDTCPPETNSDRYAMALSTNNVQHKYLLDDFGRHGFGLDGGWTDIGIDWLISNGFGVK